MKQVRKIALTIFTLIVLISCNKTSNDCELNNSSILGKYLITGNTHQVSPTSPVIDDFINADPCQKDNIFIFQPNGIYSFNDGILTCQLSVSGAGSWNISGGLLFIDGDPYTATFDCKNLVIKNTGNSNITTVTLTKQ